MLSTVLAQLPKTPVHMVGRPGLDPGTLGLKELWSLLFASLPSV